MALKGEIKKDTAEGGVEVENFNLQFTNGTLAQLRELADFLKKEGLSIPDEESEKLTEVIRVGISWLERIKENSKDEKK